ncbi:MAG: ribonucleoside-diphosphate reductase, adenosylcobalamin-dependent, partial [Chloroflexi bacterium]|nr:ribonucleoside-diphosphate reductase, adenosylcobalamin-dependent [Chloroflexota bacterium]
MSATQLRQIRKRDGSVQPFDPAKIERAINKAFVATREGSEQVAADLARKVVRIVEGRFPDTLPRVEDVQDIVEQVLMSAGYPAVA